MQTRHVGSVWVLGSLLLLAACGGGGSGDPPLVSQPQGTTLHASILPAEVEAFGTMGAYFTLGETEKWQLVTRTDLSPAFGDRTKRRDALASFVHITDVHMIDAQSPLRAPYLRQFAMGTSATGINFANTFRNQDQLGTYVTEAMLQKIASLDGGPASGRPFDFAVSTGDDGDAKQTNELQNFIKLMDGALIDPDTSGQGYIGVQDNYVPDPPSIYDMYWHPDPPPSGVAPDFYKRVFAFPEYPGLMLDAVRPFTSTGIGMPWYSGYGNHDELLQGNFPLTPTAQAIFSEIAAGTVMLLDVPPNLSPVDFLDCLSMPTPTCVEEIIMTAPKREVPANPERVPFTSRDFVAAHLASPPNPGPVGHGFSEANLAGPTLYFTFDIAPDVLGIMLDTTNPFGGADGSLDVAQAEWLQEQLISVHSSYFGPLGNVITTSNPNKLVVLFSHHNLDTMDNFIGSTAAEQRVVGAQIETLLHLFPNVILWVNGHSHNNRVTPHQDRFQRTNGFWEVSSASHVDFPQESRTVEIIDNGDGTLSIFAIIIDHAGVVNPARQGPYDILDIAGISRELAANDFLLAQVPFNIGNPEDRNVELLIGNPF